MKQVQKTEFGQSFHRAIESNWNVLATEIKPFISQLKYMTGYFIEW